MIRLGRISYVNMAPVFHRLEADVEEVSGVPTELARKLLAGEVDVAPIPSIEWARNADRLKGAATALRLVGGRRRLDPARVADPDGADLLDRGHAGERDLGRPRPRALPRRAAGTAWRGRRREAPDRRLGAPQRVRRPDAAPRPRPPLDRAHGTADGLRPLGLRSIPLRRGSRSSRTRWSPRSAALAPSRRAGPRGDGALRVSGRLPRPLLREAPLPLRPRERAALFTFLELARDAGELDRVPNLRFVHGEAVPA